MTSSTSSSDPAGLDADGPERGEVGSEGLDREDLARRERRSRRTVLSILGLWLAVEAVLAMCVPVHLGRHEVDQRVAEVAAVDRAPRTVLLSDSVSYGVLDTLTTAPEGVLDLSSNQSIGVAGNAFLLERLGRRLADADPEGRVERVLYVVSPLSLGTDLRSGNFLESNFASVFVAPRERTAVAELLGLDGLADSMRKHAWLRRVTPPSHLRRGHLRRPLAIELRRLGRELRAETLPAEPPAETRARIEHDAALERPPISDASRAFLPRLAAEARALGATLELRLAPVPPGLLEAWRVSGFLDRLDDEFAALETSIAGLVAQSRPIHVPDADAAFYDGSHLFPAARPGYAEALAATLQAP